MERIGVFLCHCSLLRPIDIQRVLGAISEKPGVVYAAPHQDMCTDPGLALVKNTVKGEKLDGVVLTSCSPSLHGEVFRDALASVGLASHQLEIADLRGQDGIEEATEQAIEVITRSVERLRISLPTITSKVPITKRALVIGGGVAGIRAALDIADSGYEVILVERTSSIGGHMIQLSETFPTLDCPQCIETPWMVDCGQHPNIKIMAYSEVEAVSGEIGNFRVSIRRKASYVDWDKCTGCEECTKMELPQEMLGLSKIEGEFWVDRIRIDERECIHCGDCVKACLEENKETQGVTTIAFERKKLLEILPQERAPQEILMHEIARMDASARGDFWQRELSKCIKCYGCRDACPLCLCDLCEMDDPQWVAPGVIPPDYPLFHLIRAYHLADICVGCGACEATCPMGIPLMTMMHLARMDGERIFDYVPGLDEQWKKKTIDHLKERPISQRGIRV